MSKFQYSNQPACLAMAFVLAGSVFVATLPAAEPEQPGLGELVVVQPELDPDGRPKVQITADKKVEIPPSLHIHRFYYTGDKEYQGPILAGGPTTVVARHPKLGKQVYVDVILPPGAPVVSYDANSITYVYTDERIRIRFQHDCECCDVDLLDGRGFDRKLRDESKATGKSLRSLTTKSKIVQSTHEQLSQRKEVVKGAIGVIDGAGAAVLDKLGQLTSMIPLVKPLESLGKQSAERGAVEEIRQAGIKQEKDAREYIRTIR